MKWFLLCSLILVSGCQGLYYDQVEGLIVAEMKTEVQLIECGENFSNRELWRKALVLENYSEISSGNETFKQAKIVKESVRTFTPGSKVFCETKKRYLIEQLTAMADALKAKKR